MVQHRLLSIERQWDNSSIPYFMAPENCKYIVFLAPYLSLLEILSQWRAFSLVRWRALPSVMLKGRYKKIPKWESTCPCGAGEGFTGYILLSYFFQEINQKIIYPLVRRFPGHSSHKISRMFLMGDHPQIIFSSVKFVAIALKSTRKPLWWSPTCAWI